MTEQYPGQVEEISRPKILIVDDISANLTAMRVLLRHVDAEIITAQSGNDALSLALDHQFALALLDVQMPEMDGFEVASFLRDNPFSAETPIVFMTASNLDELSQLKGYGAGAIDYIGKPINEQILLSKVQILLNLYRSKQQLVQALEQVHRQKQILRATFDAVGDGIIATDNTGRVSWMNPAAERMTGWTATDQPLLADALPLETSEGEPLADILSADAAAMPQGTHLMMRNRAGKSLAITKSVSVVRDQENQPIGGVIVFQDASQAYARQLALMGQVETDPLTGLLNREGFNKRLRAMMATPLHPKRDVALLFGDLDKFKPVNDTFGHAAGDVVLKAIAARMTRCIREGDVAARWAGDEFAVVMACDDRKEAEQMAERLAEAIRQPIDIGKGGDGVNVGISIGISLASTADWDHQELLEQADRLLYDKKAQRRRKSQEPTFKFS
ncbi:GGDEF domain-containing response regulator [Paracoccus laeviglucosivorans]|uniref:PAS domain S-box-containing protein/diguanylate cyclase (GGDEF) domain-containing protein n=1 Tax=Paracoccus laeviglucosivorans TaxID=1197861 RepID=A0A521D2C5_9RHOB|nr:diguanylate cyclase [Paracoccus laeviglucosivorans]SMO65844.1 PAS domain S-box-containing protein/diguanylate cyclase (GGDEF) domain-containing protein [Paracoccus laeviglucosivorans]